MPVTMDQMLAFWRGEWERVSIQIDAFNIIVRLSLDTYWRLGDGGQNFFAQQASILLNKPVEFFIDNSNSTRVFLANRQDLALAIPCELEPCTANGLSRLFPRLPNQMPMANAAMNTKPHPCDVVTPSTSFGNTTNSPGSSRSGSENSLQFGTPISDFQSPDSTGPATDSGRTTPWPDINFYKDVIPYTPSQGQGVPYPGTSLSGVSYVPALNSDLSTTFGAQSHPYQTHSPMPLNTSGTMNSVLSSSGKRKADFESDPQGQAQEG
ncbi:hypothetical protein F5X98DRAFT_373331 [Xylaria grammica]|nr:hypothetical protein F5X98DRAFT_373331 [Xylaria grammica]